MSELKGQAQRGAETRKAIVDASDATAIYALISSEDAKT